MGFVTISLGGFADGTSGMATYKKIISSLFSADQFISSSFHFDLTANYFKPSLFAATMLVLYSQKL